MRILYNSKDPAFKEPFGTLVPDESCRIRIHIPRSCKTRETQLVFTCENGDPFTSFAMQLCGGDGDYEYYETTFSLSDPGLYFYYFRITTENEAFSLFREGYDQTNMEAGELWQRSCIPASFKVPQAFAGKDRLSGSDDLPEERIRDPNSRDH